MLRLSIQARQVLAKLSLPLLFALTVAVMVVGRGDTELASAARMRVADALAPLYATLAEPVSRIRRMGEDLLGVIDLAAENRKLRAENARLRRWYQVAMALQSENEALKDNLHWLPDPAPTYVTGRVVADAGGVYGHAVLLYVGAGSPVRKGQIALDASGLVGRVIETGARSARILLITDTSSRVPVELASQHASGIMVGTGDRLPRLVYLPDGVHPHEGERVVTSAEAGAFPAGLPVGTVHMLADNEVTVLPAADLDDLSMLRIFDYRLESVVPPPAPGHARVAADASAPVPVPAAGQASIQAAGPVPGHVGP